MAIKILCDSGCDIPEDVRQAANIGLVSLSIRFGDDEYTDRVTISTQEFWQRCATSPTLPETAAPSPGAFLAAYEAAAAEGATGIIVVTISAALSATYESARVAASSFDTIPVFILDSRAVSMAQGLLALELNERAQAGATFEELCDYGRTLPDKVGVVAMLATLEHLIKGGRLGGAKALLGTMLNIKPLLQLKDGLVTEAGRQRTTSKALAALVAMAAEHQPLRRVAIVHAASPEVDALTELVASLAVATPLIVADIGPTVGTHGGPGLIGLTWLEA